VNIGISNEGDNCPEIRSNIGIINVVNATIVEKAAQ